MHLPQRACKAADKIEPSVLLARWLEIAGLFPVTLFGACTDAAGTEEVCSVRA